VGWARVAPATAQLLLGALAIGGLFAALLVAPLPLWSAQPAQPRPADSPPIEPIGWAGAVVVAVFLVGMCLPFRPYRLALRAVGQAHVSTRLLVALSAGLALIALLIYPAFGSDIFDYVGFERMWVVYGDNPLLALPSQRPTDWATPLVWYPNRSPAYGPLWAILTWPIVRLAGDSVAAEVGGFKVLSVLAYAACCWVIWVSVEPTRRQQAFVMFSWSPLVLFEVLGKVHNDVFPALGIALTLWLARHTAGRFSLVAGVAGGLVKATALAVVPAVAVDVWRRGGWRALVPAALGGLALAALVYAPFWSGPETLAPIWNQTTRLVWSPASLLILAAQHVPGGPYDTTLRAVLGLVWLAACVLVVRQSRQVASASAWLLLATLLLLTSAVFAHYLVPAVALAAVACNPRLDRVVVWLSIGGLAAYGVELLSLVLGEAWLGSDGYRVVGTLVLLLPASIALFCDLRSRHGAGAAQPAEPAAADQSDAQRDDQHAAASYVK
jgi:hypothetical protein